MEKIVCPSGRPPTTGSITLALMLYQILPYFWSSHRCHVGVVLEQTCERYIYLLDWTEVCGARLHTNIGLWDLQPSSIINDHARFLSCFLQFQISRLFLYFLGGKLY